MGKVLHIVYRAISTHLLHKDGISLKEDATGAVALIQRFGPALKLNMPQATLSRRYASIHLVEVCSLCGGSVRVIACIEDQEVIPDTHKEGRAVKRDRPSTKSWITCARNSGKHRLRRCWCHRAERRLKHSLFSPGRTPTLLHPASKEARETAWHELCLALVREWTDRNSMFTARYKITSQ
jgi:hypothetical protein